LRIWLINQYAIPPSQAGGTRHFSFARELIRRGHEITIVASSFDHVSRTETRLFGRQRSVLEIVDGVPFLWLRTPAYFQNPIPRIWSMVCFASKVWRRLGASGIGRPDVVIGSSPHLFAALAAFKIARHFQVPFVLEIRDLYPESLLHIGNVSRHHPFLRTLAGIESFLYRRADQIWTLLPNAADYIAARGGALEKIFWLPNGVDLNLMPEPRPPAGSRDSFTVMYSGTMGFVYRLDTLLDVAALLEREENKRPVVFRLLGEGPEKARLQKRVQVERIRSVQFDPAVPKAQVFRSLQIADALIAILRNLPLYQYGISLNKLYDYMAAARPIIFGINCSYNPVAESRAGLSVSAEDVPDIANAIKELMASSPEERWRMGMRGYEYVKKNHNFSHLTDKLEDSLAHLH
jgi:glycosyltransferase involved in cell wall biosynthesis